MNRSQTVTSRIGNCSISESRKSGLASSKREIAETPSPYPIRLARLWQSQGKTTEADDLLAPILGWFTEGFDTADLKEAKALINKLS